MYEEFKMRNMTWQEFAKKKDDVIILPIGATEQHGPHLPTCVDAVLAEEFAYRIAEKINGVVAPTLSYGYKSKPLSGGGPLFPGTIDLNGATLQALVMDIIDEFVRDGFTKIFILSAHFENEAFIIEAMDLCSAKYGDKVKLLLTNWWDPMSPDVIDKVFDEVEFPGWALEHAAVTETSLMMYFAPELVREDKI
ncbi:MAG: creatininase, partial [Paraclostridium sordellii]